MELTPFGIDVIELKKRIKQNKADIRHIQDSQYNDFAEKCRDIRIKKIHFMKSLKKEELNWIHENGEAI